MSTIGHYSQIFNVGHKALDNFWNGKVTIQEKIDGSQFSFCRIGQELVARSKGALIYNPDKLFRMAYEHVLARTSRLPEGWVFRAEAVCSPKHNSLVYSRSARGGIVLFDIDMGDQDYAPQSTVEQWASKLEVDYAPVFDVITEPPRSWDIYLHRESVLGGTEVEGVVAKNYSLFGLDGKVVMAKAVRPEFREVNAQVWKEAKASPVDTLIEEYRTEARWQKAVQHLSELGELVHGPQDIGSLIKEISRDVRAECEDEIKEKLFQRYWPEISRGVTRGFPEFYKGKLLDDSENS